MKKILITVMVMCLLLSSFPAVVSAEQPTDEEIAAGIAAPPDNVSATSNSRAISSGGTVSTQALNLSNGTYYLNNRYSGKYLRYYSSALSLTNGYVSTYGNSIKWKLTAVSGGYTISSTSNSTQYLGVPTSTSLNTVELVTVSSGSSIPARCIWILDTASGGGCLVKNTYNSKYLYTYGSSLYASSTTPSAGTTSYYSRVWRIANVTAMTSSKELTSASKFNTLVLTVNGSGSPTLTKSPSTAYWASLDDFTYVRSVTSYVNVSGGVFTANAEGITTITATHKVTGTDFVFAVVVGTAPSCTLSHYVDYGYRLRFGNEGIVETYHDILANKWNRIFGTNLRFSRKMHTSAADTCKIDKYGSLTMSNLSSFVCEHSTMHLTRNAMKSTAGNGSDTNMRVLWTGHILPDNPPSGTWFASHFTIITPNWCVDATSNYTNKTESEIRKQSICSLVHEVGHLFEMHDHYCKTDAENRPCSNPYCDICVYGYEARRQCIMSGWRWDIESTDNSDLFCSDCERNADEYLTTLQ